MQNRPRYPVIRDAIREAIAAHRYRSGDRLPSDAELATQFDVSRLTVIRALRDLEQQGWVERRAGSGTYVRTATAAGAHVLGLLMPDLESGEVFGPIREGIVRAGEARHQRVLWGQAAAEGAGRETAARALCEYLIERKVSGVFFAPLELTPHQDAVNRDIIAQLGGAGIPIVLVDRCYLPYPERGRYDLVGIDNRRAGYRMTRHLEHSGARRIAFAYQPGSAATVAARRAGYREARPEGRCLEFQTDGTNLTELRRFLKAAKADAFVCANDLTAAKLMHNLLALGVRIPEDVRMAGINDVKYATFLPVPLTTLRQPCQRIGAAALSTMLERLQDPAAPARDVLLECEIVVRQSCGSR